MRLFTDCVLRNAYASAFIRQAVITTAKAVKNLAITGYNGLINALRLHLLERVLSLLVLTDWINSRSDPTRLTLRQ